MSVSGIKTIIRIMLPAIGPYSQAVSAGGSCSLGQFGIDPSTGGVVEGGIGNKPPCSEQFIAQSEIVGACIWIPREGGSLPEGHERFAVMKKCMHRSSQAT